jgi:hypothetical protein
MTITTCMNTFIARAGGKIETPAPTLCNDLLELIGQQVELFRNRQKHEQHMAPVLQSITSTGGWNNWHRTPDDDPPMEWLMAPDGGEWENGNEYIGISWDDVLENEPFWLDELLEAERSYY